MALRVSIRGLKQTQDKLSKDVERIVNDIGGDTVDVAAAISPILTTNFRGNWSSSIGRVGGGTKGTPANPAPRPQPQLDTPWRIGDGDIHVYNATEYAGPLDAGYSRQAPQGVTDPTAVIIESRYSRVR